MHISQALIDEATGGLVAPGRLELTDVPDVSVPPHEHVLLAFDGSVLTCRPVPSITHLATGLCRLEVADIGLRLFGMSIERFDSIIPIGADPVTGSASSSGEKAGLFLTSRPWELRDYILEQAVSEPGMSVSVAAHLATRTYGGSLRLAEAHGQAHLRATLNWATLKVWALRWSGLAAKFDPPADRTSTPIGELKPVGCHLEDLSIGHDSLFAPGHMILSGPDQRRVVAASRVVDVQWIARSGTYDPGARSDAYFRDCERAERSAEGFCSALESDYWLHLTALDFQLIERLLCQATSATLALNGPDLGRVSLHTGIPGGGHGGNKIDQPIVSAQMAAQLGAGGLRFWLQGNLGPFEQRRLDEYARRGQQVRTEPFEHAEVEVTAPWIWLLIYSPTLGARRSEFGVQ